MATPSMSCWRRHYVVQTYLSHIFTPLADTHSASCTRSLNKIQCIRTINNTPTSIGKRTFTSSTHRYSALPRIKKEPLQPGAAGIMENRKLPILQSTPLGALLRRNDPMRTGVLAYKKGMTAIFDQETGKRLPCTILQLDRVQVTTVKTKDNHGYWAVQVGCGYRQPRNVGRSMMGHYAACRVSPKAHLVEFRVKDERGLLEPGTVLNANWFIEGQKVDVRANSKGKGFAGGMKRHGFKGQPATHGNSKNHRTMGSAGQSQGGGSRVLPGKRMAGRMGGNRVTTQGVQVLKVDPELNIVVIKGCVAGPEKCIVQIQDAYWSPPLDLKTEYIPHPQTPRIMQALPVPISV